MIVPLVSFMKNSGCAISTLSQEVLTHHISITTFIFPLVRLIHQLFEIVGAAISRGVDRMEVAHRIRAAHRNPFSISPRLVGMGISQRIFAPKSFSSSSRAVIAFKSPAAEKFGGNFVHHRALQPVRGRTRFSGRTDLPAPDRPNGIASQPRQSTASRQPGLGECFSLACNRAMLILKTVNLFNPKSNGESWAS